jgi:hypothetical protein
MSVLAKGAQVRVIAPSTLQGQEVRVVRHYPTTRNCMVALPNGAGVSWVADECLEAV